jgi:hypothetical protein
MDAHVVQANGHAPALMHGMEEGAAQRLDSGHCGVQSGAQVGGDHSVVHHLHTDSQLIVSTALTAHSTATTTATATASAPVLRVSDELWELSRRFGRRRPVRAGSGLKHDTAQQLERRRIATTTTTAASTSAATAAATASTGSSASGPATHSEGPTASSDRRSSGSGSGVCSGRGRRRLLGPARRVQPDGCEKACRMADSTGVVHAQSVSRTGSVVVGGRDCCI